MAKTLVAFFSASGEVLHGAADARCWVAGLGLLCVQAAARVRADRRFLGVQQVSFESGGTLEERDGLRAGRV